MYIVKQLCMPNLIKISICLLVYVVNVVKHRSNNNNVWDTSRVYVVFNQDVKLSI